MNLHSENSHAGDLIWSLIALSRIPGTHTLRCAPEYHQALRELVNGLPITIDYCDDIPPNSMNCWVASGLFERQGIIYRDDIDIMGFVQRYFNAMAVEAGNEPCFPTRDDMLCDFPSIHNYPTQPFEGIMVINADPKSGQCPGYSSSEMDALILRMENAGHSVCAVEKAGLSLVQIGALSIHAKLIVGCATGPWWPTMNRWNIETPRIVMLHPMRLDYGSRVPITHAANAGEVEIIMEALGLL